MIQEHQPRIKLVRQVVRRVVRASTAMTVPVVLWASIEKEMTLLLLHAVDVLAVITKMKSRRHRALGAFLGSTKTKKAGLVVKIAR